MTEAEWLAATDPQPMVKYLRRRKASARKWRLVAVACCRKRWHLLNHPQAQAAILVAERFADGQVPKAELMAASKAAYDIYVEDQRSIFDPGRDALGAASGAAMTIPGQAFNRAIYRMEHSGVCDLLREVFGNPFRPAPCIAPAWLSWNSGTVPRLAAAIYEDRAFDRLPVLADALEDAGCTDAAILGHCRAGGEHVRGCWVVDLVLGKE
jgi:hypothetical protein